MVSEFPSGPFRVSSALAAGVTRGRLRGRDLASPYYGARAPSQPQDTLTRCRAYLPLLRPGNVFSHTTAATLWNMPLPLGIDESLLHVTAPADVRAPEGRGIRGHAEALAVRNPSLVRGLPVTNAAATWLQLSTMLEWRDLVAVGDYIVTGQPFAKLLPMATLAELQVVSALAGPSRGARARARALAAIGVGPYSRPESLSGLLFTLGGLPTSLINEQVLDKRGSFLALPDRIWPAYRVAYEYEGDTHRTRRRFRSDIRRTERLVDHDWTVVRASADDLFDRPVELLTRVGARLTRAGWAGNVRELRHFALFGR